MRADAGELEQAERAAAEAERLIEELRLDELPSGTLVQVALGKPEEQRGDLPATEAAFDRAVVLARRGGRRLELAHALLLLARLKRRRRRHAEARPLVREARQVLAACPDPGTLAELLASSERALQLAPSRRPPTGAAADPDLSERELTILALLASELSQREIGAEPHAQHLPQARCRNARGSGRARARARPAPSSAPSGPPRVDRPPGW